MAVTLKDVALHAGVSRSAVSRCFTEGASVSPKMRRKVEAAAKELGYSPNALASSLTTGRTKLIGLVSNNFQNPVFLQIFDLFTSGLQDRGLRPLLVNLSQETDPAQSLDMLRRYSVDGVIVASSTLTPGFSKVFKEAGIPVIHSFGEYSPLPQIQVVGVDNVECGRIAARSFAARGYKKVAFMGGPEVASTSRHRCEGFMSELANNTDIDASFSFAESYSFDAGKKEMSRLIADGPAEAYFCGDDVLSIGALAAIKDSGRSCPDDIGILGLNDMEMASWSNVHLTTIRQPIPEIVSSSIDLMVSMLETSDETPQARVFPCTIIERGTLRAIKTAT